MDDLWHILDVVLDVATLIGVAFSITKMTRLPRRRKNHIHAWADSPRSTEETNLKTIGIYECLTCGERERRIEGGA